MNFDPSSFPSAVLSSLLDTCQTAATLAAEVLRSCLGQISPREKAPGDLVTDADHQSQNVIINSIVEKFPSHKIWSEESDQPSEWTSGFCWVIDPLDGTMNFVHQLPGFAVSIAVLFDGTPLAGVVLDPLLTESFTSCVGQGAFLNGRRIQPSQCSSLRQSLLVCSFPSRVAADSPELLRFNRVIQSATLRRLGSAALNLCYVATGRLDGYWATTLSPWDVAAGSLIVQESRAFLTNLDGNEFNLAQPDLVATSTRELAAELLPLLKLSCNLPVQKLECKNGSGQE